MTPEAVLMWLADSAVKGLVVLALGGAIIASIKRASAAARHLIGTLAVIAALMLPGLSIALPEWKVAILPATIFETEPLANLVTEGTPAQRDATVRYFGALLGLRGSIWSTGRPIADHAEQGTSWLTRENAPALILAVWLLGAVLTMLPWLVGVWSIRRLSRRGQPVKDAFISNMFRGLLWEYSIRRKVELRVGTQSITPLAWGIFRPCVLIPPEALRWPADRLRSVLLHELAHVRRWDCATQLLAQIACAVYWFNPMVWMMARWMRSEHERACDDRVLAWGLGEASYAEHLLQVARSLRAPSLPMAAVAMARASQLRDRLVSILNPARPRGRFSQKATTAALAIMLALITPLAMLHGADPKPSTTTTTPAIPQSPFNTTAVLVTEGNYYLERALSSLPPMKVRTLTPAQFEEAGPGDAGLMVFDRYTPLRTPALPCIFFAAVSSDGPTHAKQDVLTNVKLTTSNAEHPIVRGMDLSRVYVTRTLSLDPAEASTVLVKGNESPLIVLDEKGNRRMVIAFDLLQSNWPLRQSFPLFMYRAVEQLLTPRIQNDELK